MLFNLLSLLLLIESEKVLLRASLNTNHSFHVQRLHKASTNVNINFYYSKYLLFITAKVLQLWLLNYPPTSYNIMKQKTAKLLKFVTFKT